MVEFDESRSEFYDLEYFLSLEYRYLSGAHRSRIRNILRAIGPVRSTRCLDLGCGGGFFAAELSSRGADVVGLDYAEAAIRFARERFPFVEVRQGTAYDLSAFPADGFDLVTWLDAIEHMRDHRRALLEIRRVLRPGGWLVVSTDLHEGVWSWPAVSFLIAQTHRFSRDGRAYRLIRRVEESRRRVKNYHESHVALLSRDQIRDLLRTHGFEVVSHRIYPLVGVPIRDAVLRVLPGSLRGGHQCLKALNAKPR